MSWWETVPVVVVAVTILVLPGVLVSLAAGVRGVTTLWVAPPVSVGVSGVAAVVAAKAGLAWGPLPLIGLTLATAIGAWLVSLLVRRVRPALGQTPRESTGPSPWWGLVAVGIAAVLVAWRFAEGFGTPESFSQTFDNVFHLNAVRYVLENGDASSLSMSSMTSGDGAPFFYPAAWHGITALTAQLTGAAVPVAINAVNIAIGAIVWPLTVVGLVASAVRLSRWSAPLVGLVVAGFSGFPYLLVEYGVLYPNFLSYALIPGALLLIASVLRLTQVRLLAPAPGAVLGLVAMAGVALAHPNGAVLVLALIAPIALMAALRAGVAAWGSTPRRTPVVVGLGIAVVVVALVYQQVWRVVRPPFEATRWPTTQTVPQAFGEVLLNGAYGRAAAIVVSALVVLGAVWLVRTRSRSAWLVASWAVVGLLFIVVSAADDQDLRDLLTAVWYNNAPRLAAALPLVAAPLAAVGAVSLVERWSSGRTEPEAEPAAAQGERRAFVRSGVAVVAVLVLAVTVVRTGGQAADRIRPKFEVTDASPLVSTDELALISQLPDLVPGGAVLAVNPWKGGAVAFALTGLDVTHRHMLADSTDAVALIDAELADATPGSPVCDAVQEAGVGFVLDFSGKEVHGADHPFPGLEDLADSDAVELVESVGGAALYEITACD